MDKHKNNGHQAAPPKTGAFTLAQGLGVPTKHSDACWAQIKVVQAARAKLKQLAALMAKNGDAFRKYEDARKAFNEAKRLLEKDANFQEYEAARKESIDAHKALRKIGYDCSKCKASAEIAGKH